MKLYLSLPLIFLKFWFFDAPLEIINFFRSLNKAFNEAFAFTLFLRTFFKPLKNEYRQGLIGFSIAMGIIIKSVLICIDMLILVVLLTFELIVVLAFILFPLATGALIFI